MIPAFRGSAGWCARSSAAGSSGAASVSLPAGAAGPVADRCRHRRTTRTSGLERNRARRRLEGSVEHAGATGDRDERVERDAAVRLLVTGRVSPSRHPVARTAREAEAPSGRDQECTCGTGASSAHGQPCARSSASDEECPFSCAITRRSKQLPRRAQIDEWRMGRRGPLHRWFALATRRPDLAFPVPFGTERASAGPHRRTPAARVRRLRLPRVRTAGPGDLGGCRRNRRTCARWPSAC